MTRLNRKSKLRESRIPQDGEDAHARSPLGIQHRSNITLARLQDESRADQDAWSNGIGAQGFLAKRSSTLKVVELFAGAGGMGLGFMLAGRARRRFRLIFSGEIHPIYVETLRRNHLVFSRMRKGEGHNAPEEIRAFDLAKNKTLELVTSLVREAGGVDILIGGPPCQGFSSANRNSWSSDNPNNRLVSVFLKYVSRMKPPVFLMENVQGIVWTSRNGNGNALSVAEHALKRMKALGYLVFPKLLDAVWYGVPQYRTRFFLLGIRKDIGYSEEDFGSWGPFPAPTHGPSVNRPFVTVREAIGDLPIIGNGHSQDRMDYRAPAEKMIAEYLKFMRKGARRGSILDHVTSRHANYVIKRYRRIPEGGNWWDIADMMNNYSQLDRTHSNIYKRLWWNEPSITIGHYRKSMLIHPSQHRGLSLREGCRLQSFPDWFRFAGALSGRSGGLMHKQQQLANAVCPLLSKAIAEFLLEL